jgi:hypothetical protein
MAKTKKTPVEQKAKLFEQLKELESKINKFDSARAQIVGNIAKKHQLTDLSDEVLEKEFKSIKEKYKSIIDATLSTLDSGKKNS